MSNTFRRKSSKPYEDMKRHDFYRDRGRNWCSPWSLDLKKEERTKCRAHSKQEISKFLKNHEYEICIKKKYGNVWNWD